MIGRRRHELVHEYAAGLGHVPTLAERMLIERAAILQLTLEGMEREPHIALDDYQKAASALRRLLASLRLVKGVADYTGVKERHQPTEAVL
jgi:hypothetical protein